MANLRAQQERMLTMKDPWIVNHREATGYSFSSYGKFTAISLRDRPVVELIAGFSRLLESGKGADMTVICGGESRKYHKSIVCSRSDYFSKALEGDFQEAKTGVITLPDDVPSLVWKMMRYFYVLDYSAFGDVGRPLQNESILSLYVHANMYHLADKYQNEGLKFLAAEKFTSVLIEEFGSGETRDNQAFLDLIKILGYVCEGSEIIDDLLQEAVTATIFDYLEVLVPMPEFKDVLLRVPEIGFKIITKQVELGQKMREKELHRGASWDAPPTPTAW